MHSVTGLGTWQVTQGSAAFAAVTAVSATSPVLLQGSDQVQYVGTGSPEVATFNFVGAHLFLCFEP